MTRCSRPPLAASMRSGARISAQCGGAGNVAAVHAAALDTVAEDAASSTTSKTGRCRGFQPGRTRQQARLRAEPLPGRGALLAAALAPSSPTSTRAYLEDGPCLGPHLKRIPAERRDGVRRGRAGSHARTRDRLRAARTSWRAAQREPAGGTQLLVLLCAASALTLIVLGTRLTFFNDDWYFIFQRPGFSADSIFEPHNGHLSALSVLIYKGLIEVFGLDFQLPFRAVLATSVVSLGVLVYLLVEERAGSCSASSRPPCSSSWPGLGGPAVVVPDRHHRVARHRGRGPAGVERETRAATPSPASFSSARSRSPTSGSLSSSRP